jgi:DNA primase
VALNDIKERIKESPVSLVIGNYLALSKKGSNLEALCPFHSDSKPSLKVNDAKGMYKCFACGASGNAISFVMNLKNLEYVEALKEICSILGLPFEDPKDKRKNPKTEIALRVLDATQRIYLKFASLQSDTFNSFLEQRKLKPETAQLWGIGLAPAQNVLFQYLDKLEGETGNQARQLAKEIGLVKFNETRNSHFDFFRDRITFPIVDHSGTIKGFSCRSLGAQQNPKYLNSSESFIFSKSSILFGYYFAKAAIREQDQVILVEGNIDVIMMHQYGIKQTVGTMGTALSESSIRTLSNMTKNIYLALDSDAAGDLAMLRINAAFMAAEILPKFLSFAPYKDPDEFLLQEGGLALRERIEKAPIHIDTVINKLIPEKPPENTDIKLKILHQVFAHLLPMKEHLLATERIIDAAKRLNLRSDPATILEQYKKFLSTSKEKAPFAPLKPKNTSIEAEEPQTPLMESIPSPGIPMPETASLNRSEKLVLKELVAHPEFLTHPNLDEFLATIKHDEVKRLIHWLVKIYLEIDDSEFISIVQDELQTGGYSKEIFDVATEALFNDGTIYDEKVMTRLLKDYQKMLKLDQLKAKRKLLVEKQKTSETQTEVDSILTEISIIDKEILGLK